MSTVVVTVREISLVAQTLALSARAIRNTLRQPQQWVPSFLFPLLLLAVNTSALGKVIRQQGVDSYLNFALATVIVQGILFAASNSGGDLAIDIQDGFFDRLVASPIARPAILLGRLSASLVLGVFQAAVIMIVLALFGARVAGGAPAIAVIALAAGLLAVGIGSMSCAVAVRSGSSETVQAMTPLFTMFIFFSSAYFPKDNMVGWFRGIVSANPIDWTISAMRDLILDGFDTTSALKATVIPILVAVLGVTLATLAMSRRLRDIS